ncbi:hypothetical protein [Arthrobacter sp. AD-310]
MHRKSLLGAAVCTLALVGLSSGPAFAQGQTERGPEHANSICSFSGLNDEPDDPVEGGRVQSYGQAVRADFLDPTDKTSFERPGTLCNGHDWPYPEAFEGMGP